MSAARRNHRRRDWPRGLYEPRPGYYVWRHPDGTTWPLGRVSLAVAKNESLGANTSLATERPNLVERLQGAEHTVADLLGRMPAGEKPNTVKQWASLDKKVRQAWGPRMVASITVKDVAELLEAQGDKLRTALSLRTRLVRLFRKGMALGWCKSNPAEATERPQPKVTRGRLTLATFQAVQALAPEWFQRVMTLALVLGADESTLVTLHRKMVTDGALTFTRVKTGAFLEVPIALRLEVIGVSLAELVPARGYFVTNPDPHGNAAERITASHLSKTFTRYRKAAGLPSANEGGPSFHEIRSLCRRLYDAQGNVDTQALLGHADERTGLIYADARGVEPRKVRVS